MSWRTIVRSVFVCLLVSTGAVLAADPGDVFPETSQWNDQKPGSVLFFPVYTSSASNPAAQNSQLNLTNTSSTSAAFVHTFWIANNCQVADRYICLTAQQTVSIDTFEQDPGVTGYMMAVAVDGQTGCPIIFNHLIGDEYAKFSNGFFGSLGAEAVAALPNQTNPRCDPLRDFSFLYFGTPLFNDRPGQNYNPVPRVIAIGNLGSPADGYSHLVFIDVFNGDLRFNQGGSGPLFGLLFDEAEQSYSFNLTSVCQGSGILGNNFPRTTPRFEEIIPANSTGWMKIWPTIDSNVGIYGAIFTRNVNAATNPNAYNGARNFHVLRLANSSYVIPVFPPTC